MAPNTAPVKSTAGNTGHFSDREKPKQIRDSNITAAKAVCDAIRTSLGPRGMDKMIQSGSGDVTITNDGATILKQMQVVHPAAKLLVDLSKAQDIEAGDGTTSVVVMAGSLLDASSKLLDKGIHPTTISESFQLASAKAVEILNSMAIPIELNDRESLLKSATTALSSKVVSQHSMLLAPLAVDAVIKVIDPAVDTNVNLKDIKVMKQLGGTVDDVELIDGLLFKQRSAGLGGVTKVEKAKIGLIQFCVSPPKTNVFHETLLYPSPLFRDHLSKRPIFYGLMDGLLGEVPLYKHLHMDNRIIVSDYTQMDRVLRDERAYLLNIVKQVKKAGCNVLLIQKSILRDAVTDLALHFFAKMKIMVIKDIEREDIEFICKTLNCRPVASLDHFVPEALGSADLVEEFNAGGVKYVKVTGVANPGKTVTLFLRGSNNLVLEEAERSLHDALCVIRCLVKKRALIAGGGAPEIELSIRLAEYARTLTGMDAYCVRAYADAFEIIPYTLAENAGLNAIATVTDLRTRHARGEKNAGINVRKGSVTNILEENVVQPLLVSISAVTLASETVQTLMKIDDIVNVVR